MWFSALGSQVPTLCAVCRSWSQDALCIDCMRSYARLSPRCPGCALPLAPGLALCQTCAADTERPLHTVFARVHYAWPWTSVVASFKFKADLSWAGEMAAMMLDTADVQDLLREADGLIPIPLARSRLVQRGYNQSWEVVKQLQHRTGTPGLPDALIRRETAQLQHELSLDERHQHAKRALAIGPAGVRLPAGGHWVLVDDVMTTGATLRAAAQLLRDHGARCVSGVVFARTPSHESDAHAVDLAGSAVDGME